MQRGLPGPASRGSSWQDWSWHSGVRPTAELTSQPLSPVPSQPVGRSAWCPLQALLFHPPEAQLQKDCPHLSPPTAQSQDKTWILRTQALQSWGQLTTAPPGVFQNRMPLASRQDNSHRAQSRWQGLDPVPRDNQALLFEDHARISNPGVWGTAQTRVRG